MFCALVTAQKEKKELQGKVKKLSESLKSLIGEKQLQQQQQQQQQQQRLPQRVTESETHMTSIHSVTAREYDP